ncbi:hypothetical protein CDAR_246781 [Caerostris darwini]|uniref:Uncharacterized protein n=1 Tax=Caerostris darwini TaxID=1538125 RepID=A0AAV4TAY8_9ARAC|nr:hypothetical protein CDAR_246781 [Caerostris darwini]
MIPGRWCSTLPTIPLYGIFDRLLLTTSSTVQHLLLQIEPEYLVDIQAQRQKPLVFLSFDSDNGKFVWVGPQPDNKSCVMFRMWRIKLRKTVSFGAGSFAKRHRQFILRSHLSSGSWFFNGIQVFVIGWHKPRASWPIVLQQHVRKAF